LNNFMKLKIKYLFISCLLVSRAAICSGDPILADSIINLLSTANDSLKIVLMSKLAEEYKSTSLEKCLEYEKQSLFIAQEADRPDWRAKAHLRIGRLYNDVEMFPEAIDEYKKALPLAEEIMDNILIEEIGHELGTSYFNNDQVQEGLESFKEALKLANLSKDTLNVILNNISIAELFLSLNDRKEALYYFDQCIPYLEKVEYYHYHVKVLMYISEINSEEKRFITARKNLTQASRLAEKADLNYETVDILYHLGLNFIREGNIDIGMFHYDLGLVEASKYDYKDLIVRIKQELAMLYEINGDYAKALSYRKHVSQLKDSLKIHLRDNKISFLDMKYDSEKKGKDLELLKKEEAIQNAALSKQKRLRFYFIFVSIILIAGAGFSIRGYLIRKGMTGTLNYKKKLLEETQENLLETEQNLKNLNETKNKLFSIMAHDLINPFNALLGFASLLEEESNQLNKTEIKEYSSIIYQTANNIFSLLENLLQWSQSQTGKIITRKDNIDISEIIQSVTELLKPIANNKNISINTNIDNGCFAFADQDLISSAIRSLVQNAIKFSPSGSKIQLTGLSKQGQTIISVADEGVGINVEDRGKIFHSDIHLSTPGTSNETGAGLGLIITREFILLNNGSIDLKSSPGKGSTFTITLPARENTD